MWAFSFGENLSTTIDIFTKKIIDMPRQVRYDFDLNGYSLIPSWWRDRPNETQQPANEKKQLLDCCFFPGKGANLTQGNCP